jgi:hypothetical protein
MIVAYSAASRTVVGGRLLEARATGRLRSTDVDPPRLRAALDLIAATYPDAEHVVPGRGEPGTLAILEHTRMLAAECRSDDECVVTPEDLSPCACCGCIEPRSMPRTQLEALRSERPDCQPVCDEHLACLPCPAPESLPRPVCRRGECGME